MNKTEAIAFLEGEVWTITNKKRAVVTLRLDDCCEKLSTAELVKFAEQIQADHIAAEQPPIQQQTDKWWFIVEKTGDTIEKLAMYETLGEADRALSSFIALNGGDVMIVEDEDLYAWSARCTSKCTSIMDRDIAAIADAIERTARVIVAVAVFCYVVGFTLGTWVHTANAWLVALHKRSCRKRLEIVAGYIVDGILSTYAQVTEVIA